MRSKLSIQRADTHSPSTPTYTHTHTLEPTAIGTSAQPNGRVDSFVVYLGSILYTLYSGRLGMSGAYSTFIHSYLHRLLAPPSVRARLSVCVSAKETERPSDLVAAVYVRAVARAIYSHSHTHSRTVSKIISVCWI